MQRKVRAPVHKWKRGFLTQGSTSFSLPGIGQDECQEALLQHAIKLCKERILARTRATWLPETYQDDKGRRPLSDALQWVVDSLRRFETEIEHLPGALRSASKVLDALKTLRPGAKEGDRAKELYSLVRLYHLPLPVLH